MTMQTLGNRLARWRKDKGLSQAAAAKRAGVRTESWGRYERDERVPDANVLARLGSPAEVAWIVSGGGPGPPAPGEVSEPQAFYGRDTKEARVLRALQEMNEKDPEMAEILVRLACDYYPRLRNGILQADDVAAAIKVALLTLNQEEKP